MKIRADLQVNSESRKLVLAAIDNETSDHLGLKLAAYLFFWKEDLMVSPSLKTPALMGQAFRPDLLAVDITGEVSVWIECGNTSEHKLSKVLKRWPEARIFVMKENQRVAMDYRRVLTARVPKSDRVKIIYWPEGAFKEWMSLLSEKTEVIGETNDSSLNLVVNEGMCVVDLMKC